jgi:LPXTG-motif cell wall-anchored protein
LGDAAGAESRRARQPVKEGEANMKIVGILAMIGGLIIVLMNLPWLTGKEGTAPQVVAGVVVLAVGILLFRRK